MARRVDIMVAGQPVGENAPAPEGAGDQCRLQQAGAGCRIVEGSAVVWRDGAVADRMAHQLEELASKENGRGAVFPMLRGEGVEPPQVIVKTRPMARS